MSVLTDMAKARIERLNESIKHQNEYIATTKAELAAAEEDLVRWTIDRDEIAEFLQQQGIDITAA